MRTIAQRENGTSVIGTRRSTPRAGGTSQPPAFVVYDWDNTIAYTEPIIRDAYVSAGAPDPPDNFMELTWQDWLLPEVGMTRALDIRKRKNAYYLEAHLLREPDLLRAYDDACYDFDHDRCVGLLTGAPWLSMPGFVALLPRWPFHWAVANQRIGNKLQILQSLASFGTYVDDLDYAEEIFNIGWSFRQVL